MDALLSWEHDVRGDGVPLVAHLPCGDCGSSDALSIYSNGTYCFSCSKFHSGEGTELLEDKPVKEIENPTLSKGMFGPIKDRGISKDTAKFYGVAQVLEGEVVTKHIYPYYLRGKKVGQKVRNVATKDFFSEGNMRTVGLFGQQLFPASKKPYIIVTEGELDALAAFQMTGGIYPCVSIAKGATGAAKEIQEHLEYLNSFGTVVLCFDKDQQGELAAAKVAKLFAPNKCKIFQTNPIYKDACDYLSAGKGKEFTDTLYQSPVYTPAGILDLYDLHDRFLEKRKRLTESNLQYPYEGLNEKTYGIRTGEFVIITAQTGVGKTSFLREVQNHLLNTSDVKIGVMYIEEEGEDTYGLTFGPMVKQSIHLPTVDIDLPELQKAREKIGKGRVYVYEHFGSSDFDEILERIRYMVKGLGCEIIILDHISMLVSDQRYDDERRALDAISTKLKQLTVELGVGILAIAHKNREGQIRGSAMIEKLANIVFDLDRDLINEDPDVRNQTKLVVTKNRFSGETGPACTLMFDRVQNKLVEMGEPMAVA